ncbi:MAG: SusC/RagA family TonB-linked outer membrane protein [Marinilabiliaceae bacterium]|nr:SusC/RagA family TonB-linked outer membrane protein [Marinilabiliaceae bacterium]
MKKKPCIRYFNFQNSLRKFSRLLLISTMLLVAYPIGITASDNVFQQEDVLIKGKITDSKGDPLVGVNVYETSNVSQGVITDFEGNYVIEISSNDSELTFSYIGFLTQKLRPSGRNEINVILEDEFNDLDEIVVVGYGTQKKVNMTGAVASVDKKMLDDRPTENLLKSIQGTVPGVVIIDRPSGVSINIRGRGNLGSSSPLYIVDGVEVSSDFFGSLDPNSIENLTFLKDASSAAIYGAKAAYGVVLVKTKTGNGIGKCEISYNGSVGFAKPTYLPKTVSSYDYAKLYRQASLNSNPNAEPFFTEEMVEHYRTGDSPDLYPNTDWIDLLMNKNPMTTKHSLQFAGSTEKMSYNIGLGYMNYETFAPGVENDKYNFSLKVSSSLSDLLF